MVNTLTHEGSQSLTRNIDLAPFTDIERPSSDYAKTGLGIKAVGLSQLPNEHADGLPSSASVTESEGNMSSNVEGIHNAELFKQSYDSVIQAIDHAFEAKGPELSSKLDDIVSSIDVLSATPYISSVPEFVDLAGVARREITEASFYITRQTAPEVSKAIANALNQAKKHLSRTTVAYRPQV